MLVKGTGVNFGLGEISKGRHLLCGILDKKLLGNTAVLFS